MKKIEVDFSKYENNIFTNTKTYKAIKHYDKRQLNKFLLNFYKNAFNDGLRHYENNTSLLDDDVIINAISNVKGIGPKLLDKIKIELEKEIFK